MTDRQAANDTALRDATKRVYGGRTHAPGETITAEQYRKLVAKSMSEAEVQADVIDRAHALGWMVAAFRKVRVQRKDGSVYYETPVQADGKGWLDLYLVREARAVAAELKVHYKKPTPEQERWMALHRATGIEVYCWLYPRDIVEIDRVLA